jgi:hypothetical protein
MAKMVFRKDIAITPAPGEGCFFADPMITSAVLNGKGRLPLS